jgi:Uncharacterized iron-regulated membrane protein
MRKFFAKIHLWLSIPFGFIVAIVCFTGAVLVFETEIQELRNPSHYFVKEIKGEPLPLDVLINSAIQQLPDSIKVSGIRITPDSKRTYRVVIPGKRAGAFIDPYTGKLTGVDYGQGFFMQMERIHRWLFSEYKRDGNFSWGKALVGYSCLVLVVILISGIIIWIPRSKKGLKNRLKIKTNKGGFRFWYDLHVSGGFYATLFLLVLTLTGLTWSFGWYRTAFFKTFGVDISQTQGHPHAATDSESKGKKKKSTDYTKWTDVMTTLQSKYSDYNSITIQDGSATVSTAKYGNTRGSDRYLFDPETGNITAIQLYKDLSKSSKIRGWIYSVHVGSWGGITTRILSCLVSLLGGVFAITGYYFWIKKKMRKRR